MRIVITGASGFVGRHACRVLAREFEVHALVRNASTRAAAVVDSGATVHGFDDDHGAAEIVRSLSPEVVVHLATLFPGHSQARDIGALVDANVRFGGVIAAAACDVSARLVTTSSAWQHFGGAEYAPVSAYAATKEAFLAVARYFVEVEGLSLVELVLFDTYGPEDDRGKLVSQLLQAAASGRHLAMSSGHQLINLTQVEDVVDALRLAMYLPGGRFAVKAPGSVSVRELARLVEVCTDHKLNIGWGARPERAREMTDEWDVGPVVPGWAPRISLEDGIRELWRSSG